MKYQRKNEYHIFWKFLCVQVWDAWFIAGKVHAASAYIITIKYKWVYEQKWRIIYAVYGFIELQFPESSSRIWLHIFCRKKVSVYIKMIFII